MVESPQMPPGKQLALQVLISTPDKPTVVIEEPNVYDAQEPQVPLFVRYS